MWHLQGREGTVSGLSDSQPLPPGLPSTCPVQGSADSGWGVHGDQPERIKYVRGHEKKSTSIWDGLE